MLHFALPLSPNGAVCLAENRNLTGGNPRLS
jgi:hypothetical protein